MVDAGRNPKLRRMIRPMYEARSLPGAISHRGLHDSLPENSIPAFLAAIDAGAEAVELDIHATSDDVLIVHHDPVVNIDGSPVPIASVDSTVLSKLRLKGDLPIPTLDDTLQAIGSRAGLFIEIKGRGIETALIRCLRRHSQNMDAYAIHSFDHRTVKRMIELIPSVRTGILQVSYLVDSCRAMRAAGATDLWQLAEFIDDSLVVDVHSCGGRVIAWTPNTPADWETLSAAGVDGICTDRVDRYSEWRASRE